MKGKNGLTGRRGILVFLAAAASFFTVAAFASPPPNASSTVAPNIVLVLTDDLVVKTFSLTTDEPVLSAASVRFANGGREF